jgi:hypothetical protein
MNTENAPEQIRDIILEALDENKAEDVVTIDLAGKSSIADYMIIATGRSSRHVVGLSNHKPKAVLIKPNLTVKKMVIGFWGMPVMLLFTFSVMKFVISITLKKFGATLNFWQNTKLNAK